LSEGALRDVKPFRGKYTASVFRKFLIFYIRPASVSGGALRERHECLERDAVAAKAA
jgi:hypothetical protein